MTTASDKHTFLESLVAAIEGASAYNSQDQVPPAAVLWPDGERQWESLLPALRNQLPVFALGEYSPDENTGPAYWLRCIIARTIPHPSLQDGQVPVLYLPGHSRSEFRVMESCPPELEPLAELQVPRNPLVPKKRKRLDHRLLPAKQGRRPWDRCRYGRINKGSVTAIPLETRGRAIGIALQGDTNKITIP